MGGYAIGSHNLFGFQPKRLSQWLCPPYPPEFKLGPRPTQRATPRFVPGGMGAELPARLFAKQKDLGGRRRAPIVNKASRSALVSARSERPTQRTRYQFVPAQLNGPATSLSPPNSTDPLPVCPHGGMGAEQKTQSFGQSPKDCESFWRSPHRKQSLAQRAC